jgi:hypothetical protein
MMRRILLILAVSLVFGGTEQASSQTLTRGPYQQLSHSSGITVRWRTDSSTDSVVRYGTTLGNLNQTQTVSGNRTEHEVELSGLASGTLYYYSVGNTAGAIAGGDASHTFRTAPATGSTGPMRIWVIGDSGTGDANASAVYNAYQTFTQGQETDLWLMLGDNAYANNGNPEGTDAGYQTAVFDVYPELLRQAPLWPALGNHDTDLPAYLDMFTLPTLGESGGVASGSENYYSFDFGNVHFVCLDSQHSDVSTSGPMYSWLINDLNAAIGNYEWLIAFWHHPPYSSTEAHHSDKELRMIEMRENFVPVLEAYGVDLVLGGHAHNYQRTFLINGLHGYPGADQEQPTSGLIESVFAGDPAAYTIDSGDGDPNGTGAYTKAGQMTPERGTIYSVTGSSGKATHGGAGSFSFSAFGQKTLGSLVLDISDTQLDASFIDETGTVLDSYRIVHTPATPSTVTADAGTDQTVPDSDQVNGESVQLDGSGSTDTDGTIVSYDWSWDDNGPQSAIGVSPVITLPDGAHNITLTVTDNDSNTDSDVVQVTVQAYVPPGSSTTLFEDDFSTVLATGSSSQMDPAKGWVTVGNWMIGSTDGPDGSNALRLRHGSSIATKMLDTTGYDTVTLDLDAATKNYETGENATIETTTDGGSSWQIALTLDHTDTTYGSYTVSLPANNSNAGFRFYGHGNLNTEHGYFDNILVTGSSSSPVNNAPAFGTDPIVEINALEDAAYSSTIADDASDADSDPLSFSAIAGPAWLNIASDGNLSGTPSGVDVGANSWMVQVSDGHGGTDSATLEITVDAAPVNQPPAFAADPINKANAIENGAYNGSLAGDASDPENDSLTFSKVSGPAWLNVATDGTLSGTPGSADVGSNAFTVQVSATGGSDTATLNITVDTAPSGPQVIFSDDFESGSLLAGGWAFLNADEYMGGAAYNGSFGANIRRGGYMSRTVSTVGFSSVEVSYWRQGLNLVAPEYLTVEWSVDGSTWNTIENIQTAGWSQTVVTLPAGAAGQAGFTLRFDVDSNRWKEKAYIDDIVITAQ